MPRAGFYNDNEYRAYPFVFGPNFNAVTLPNTTILDAGVIMGLMSEFDPTQHTVWLKTISRAANVFTFEFRTDAPGAISQPLIFTRPASAVEWLSEQVTEENWEGFFVTGPLTALAAQLPNGSSLTLTNTSRVLEPARIQSLVKSYLRSISLGNYRRTFVTPAADCENSSSAVNVREIVVNAEALQGDLRLKEGYNCRISQTDFNREIRVAAEVGAGATPDSELCSRGGELPLYEGEEPLTGSQFLSGGPACNEIISTINGIGGPNVTLVGGAGIGVIADSANNLVRIAIDNNKLVGNCGT